MPRTEQSNPSLNFDIIKLKCDSKALIRNRIYDRGHCASWVPEHIAVDVVAHIEQSIATRSCRTVGKNSLKLPKRHTRVHIEYYNTIDHQFAFQTQAHTYYPWPYVQGALIYKSRAYRGPRVDGVACSCHPGRTCCCAPAERHPPIARRRYKPCNVRVSTSTIP